MKQQFVSPTPEVVGWFDAEAAQEAATAAVRPAGERAAVTGVHYYSKLESLGLTVPVNWTNVDAQRAHEPSGDASETAEYYAKNWKYGEADYWHFDTQETKDADQVPCSTLVGASKWPTLFLKGVFSVEEKHVSKETAVPLFDLSDVQHEIEEALRLGDLEPVPMAEGLVLLAPVGAIHKRNVPSTYVGARYFRRHFPGRINRKYY